MTAKELQKRNEKSQHLRVIQVDDSNFYVESSEGKVCYRVSFDNDQQTCSCGDFVRGTKTDPTFRCKHIISVYNCIPTGEVQYGQILERAKPKLDERWLTTIEGREFVKYPGLLDLGHQKGIAQIEVEVIQLPTAENGHFAVCKATVVSKTGESFIDIGDANPSNCSSKVSKHLLRMASTRAIARALRSFCNIGITALEEIDIADLSEVRDSTSKGNIKTGKPAVRPKSNGKPSGDQQKKTVAPQSVPDVPGSKPPEAKAGENTTTMPPQPMTDQNVGEKPTSEPKMSEAQRRAIYNLSRRRGISVEELQRMATDAYGIELEHLSTKDASSFIRSLQQAA